MTDPAPLAPWTPRRPTLTAALVLGVWILLLALPMLDGQWLANAYSDQIGAGWGFRTWGASEFRRTGSIPLWNPLLFGGLPFVAAQHGDIFYPTSFLRLVLSAPAVVNLNFVVHYLLAGLLTYAFLRRLGVAWAAAVTGGMAYMLSGIMGSYPLPGHDGKLIVSSLLPLLLLALVLALRERRVVGYPLVTLATALALLSPHYQMTYYMLVAGGVVALVLALDPSGGEAGGARLGRLGLCAGAVLLGFAVSTVQVLPFYHYLPFSPRATGIGGFDRATSYAIPWDHVPEMVFAAFTGVTLDQSYWGSNPLKLHSEYLGLTVVALALLGARHGRGRLGWALAGVGLLFLLVALGAATPFYRLWYAVMPFVKSTRAPGMAFFVPAFVVACFAGFGADRLLRREGRGMVTGWAAAGALVLLLALAGGVAALAEGFASGIQASLGRPAFEIIRQHRGEIALGAAGGAVALLVLAGVAFAWLRGRLPGAAVAVGLPLLVGGDLALEARRFWRYTPIEAPLYRGDDITARLQVAPAPARVLDLDVYPQSVLMGYGIPQLLGYHGNELHAFDELLGGKNQWRNLGSLTLWDLYGINHLTVPGDRPAFDTLPGWRRTLTGVTAASGQRADLWERLEPEPYARVVALGAGVPDADAIQALAAGRPFHDQLVLLDPASGVAPLGAAELPPPSAARAAVARWEPGRMTLRLDPVPPAPSWLVVGENWYPDWRATVDGAPARVVRGNVAMLAVELPAGAREVRLEFRSGDYATGRAVSLAAAGLGLLALVGAVVADRRPGGAVGGDG